MTEWSPHPAKQFSLQHPDKHSQIHSNPTVVKNVLIKPYWKLVLVTSDLRVLALKYACAG